MDLKRIMNLNMFRKVRNAHNFLKRKRKREENENENRNK
jgi:hypothetical protein